MAAYAATTSAATIAMCPKSAIGQAPVARFSLELGRALGEQRRRLERAVRPDLPFDDDLDLVAEDVRDRPALVVDRHLAAAVVDQEADRQSGVDLLDRARARRRRRRGPAAAAPAGPRCNSSPTVM